MPRKNLMIVDNQAMKEMFGLSDKAVTVKRRKIRLKFGLTKEEIITTYHVAEFTHTPIDYIESHLR